MVLYVRPLLLASILAVHPLAAASGADPDGWRPTTAGGSTPIEATNHDEPARSAVHSTVPGDAETDLRERIDAQAEELRALREEVRALRNDPAVRPPVLPLASGGIESNTERPVEAVSPNDATSQESAPPTPVLAGYDNGFFIRDADGLFRLRVNSWFHFRHTAFDSDAAAMDEHDLEFERVRLAFQGHALTPSLTYFLQLDGDNDQRMTVDLLDYFVKYDFGHDVFGRSPGRIGLRLGQWKLPLQRSRGESGQKLQFTDRAVSSIFFDINRSIGAALYGGDEDADWEVAVFNGFNTQGLRPARRGEIDRNLGTSARLAVTLFGEWDNEGEPDLVPNACPAFRVGAGFAHSRVDREGALEFARFRTTDTGATIAGLIPAAVNAYSVQLYTVDAHYKHRGLSVIADYYFRHANDFDGAAVPNLYDHGFLVQGGYMLVPERLEAIGRWSRVVGDSTSLGIARRSVDEVAGGVVWYIRGHRAKVTFDVTHLNGSNISDRTLNILPGDSGWLYRTQFQLSF